MPESLQSEHAAWVHGPADGDSFARAHRLATTMLELGDEPSMIEHQLVALGVGDAVAAEVADNALRLER
jgi:hypothetical protein